MITNHHFMANSENGSHTNSEKQCAPNKPGIVSGVRKKLIMFGAAIGLGTAGCSAGNAQETKAPEAKEMKLASADEAKAFASLSQNIQQTIRSKYNACIDGVRSFAKDGSGGSKEVEQILFEDGVDDCDDMRKNRIGSAVAKTHMEDLTRSITSGS